MYLKNFGSISAYSYDSITRSLYPSLFVEIYRVRLAFSEEGTELCLKIKDQLLGHEGLPIY